MVLLLAPMAFARTHVRRHFEPTDLELEEPGTTELDLETGFARSQDAWRAVAPDYELDLGLGFMISDILQVDGTFIKSFDNGIRNNQKRFSMLLRF